MKKLCILFSVILIVGIAPIAICAGSLNDNIRVTIDGEQVNFVGQTPIIVNDRTLVPVRGVFEQLGFYPAWNNETRQATLTRADYTIVITIGSNVFITNGQSHHLDVYAQIINDATLLPLRHVLESIGYELNWDGNTRTVLITTGGAASTAQPTNLAGQIIIAGSRLYLDEVRVYVTDSSPPDGMFWLHAGENVIVIAGDDNSRLSEFGFYEIAEDGSRNYGIFPNGYAIEPLNRDIVVFEITEETIFTFVDTQAQFVDPETNLTRRHYTTNLEEFITHRGQQNTPGYSTIIVFLQVLGERVISVTEEFLFTQ